MKIVDGDLLEMAHQGAFDVIVHGCNCFCIMGAGIAAKIKHLWPNVYVADTKTKTGDKSKLGTFTSAIVDDVNCMKFTIINAYTQYDLSRYGRDVFEYDAFQKILNQLANDPLLKSASFGFPMIGTGLAGGCKERIVEMLEDFSKKIESTGGTVTLVDFKNGS
jgi:O-acetyl-ADP-ribose deacetylase (regulator of RNase III)